jgi:hypothetical protein
MSRINELGSDVGRAYQEDCISSWTQAGFEPISVNSRREIVKQAVRMIRVDRDASTITGRPHVYFGDLIDAARSEAFGSTVAMVNADILFPPRTDLADRVSDLRPGQVIFSRRLDRADPERSPGTPYPYGFDFFAAHADDLTGLSDTHLVFGAPWWDHFFPLAMHMRGCHLEQIEPAVIHLEHTERWSPYMWEVLGRRFLSEVQAVATDESYRVQLERALKDRIGGPRARLRTTIGITLHVHTKERALRRLRRVSDLNVSFLDRLSLPDF